MKNNKKGFTLVEVVIYLALLVILMVGVISFALSSSGVYIKGRSMEEVLYGARQIERVLGYYIKEEASETIVPQRGTVTDNLSLVLENGSFANFYLDNGILMMEIDGELPLAISSNEIEIRNLRIQNQGAQDITDSINISCTVAFKNIESSEYRYEFDFNLTSNTKS